MRSLPSPHFKTSVSGLLVVQPLLPAADSRAGVGVAVGSGAPLTVALCRCWCLLHSGRRPEDGQGHPGHVPGEGHARSLSERGSLTSTEVLRTEAEQCKVRGGPGSLIPPRSLAPVRIGRAVLQELPGGTASRGRV